MFTSTDRIHTANQEMRAMIEEAGQMLKRAHAATGDEAAALRSQGMALLADGIAKGHALERKATHSVHELATATDRLVHANPWRSVAVAGVVGAGIGLLLGIAVARD
ncbi:MAG: hypothetical protein V4633_18680 [Pseudomonadota bacterium]